MAGWQAHNLRKLVYRLLSLVLLLVALGLAGGTSQAAVPTVIGALTPDFALVSGLASVRRQWQSMRTTRRAEQ
ncbi:MAG TPA: hypothetical protein VGS20_07725 [Candidatus Acidoferrales bacterium]|nr:hypothetical protein [Candidatus Acidoferrales bacterium]